MEKIKNNKIYKPADISKALLRSEKLANDIAFEHLSWNSQSAYGLSAAVIESNDEIKTTTISNQDCFDSKSKPISPETLFNIASITKPITVATILRMIETDRFEKFFQMD